MLSGSQNLKEERRSTDGKVTIKHETRLARSPLQSALRILTQHNTLAVLDGFRQALQSEALDLLAFCALIFTRERAHAPISAVAHQLLSDAIIARGTPERFIDFFIKNEKYAAANYQLALLYKNCSQGDEKLFQQECLDVLASAIKKNYAAAITSAQCARDKVLEIEAEQQQAIQQPPALSKRRRVTSADQPTNGEEPAQQKPRLPVVSKVKNVRNDLVPIEVLTNRGDGIPEVAYVPKSANLIARILEGEEPILGMSLFRESSFPEIPEPDFGLEAYRLELFNNYRENSSSSKASSFSPLLPPVINPDSPDSNESHGVPGSSSDSEAGLDVMIAHLTA
jgi:hypothetical protein